MKFCIVKAEQRSELWFASRAGRVTGSKADAVLAKIKSGEAAARRDYRLQLAVETITGKPMDEGVFVNAAMQHGIDCEPLARAAIEDRLGLVVHETGFLACEDIMAGCSLDGHCGDFREIVEIKCPKSSTHVGYLKAGRLPPDYVAQVSHNLWVTGAEACHFVSFDDRLPEGLDFFHVRVARADLDIDGYAAEATRFLAEVEAEVEALRALRKAA